MAGTERSRLREHLLGRFRWVDRHADYSAVLADPETLALIGQGLVGPFHDSGITLVVGLEARGFALGGLAAVSLGVGLVLARKEGAVHPGPKVEVTTASDWRGRVLRIQLAKVLGPSDRVLVDDWIKTGSQAKAVQAAVEECGATLIGVSVLVDDTKGSVPDGPALEAVLSSADLPRPT